MSDNMNNASYRKEHKTNVARPAAIRGTLHFYARTLCEQAG